MNWRKLGLLYCPDGSQAWANAHAMLPTVRDIDGYTLRVYFSSTDANTVGRVSFIDVSRDDPTILINVSTEPVLDIGEAGCFDDNGVIPSSFVELGNTIRLYYVGFQLQRKIPYTMFTGLAESQDNGRTFARVSRSPVLDRGDRERFFRTAPFVRREAGYWQMWYIAGSGWTSVSGVLKPTYQLCYAQSLDGIVWPREGIVCLEPDISRGEFGFGRPFVIRERERYLMWYSIRSASGYLIGYAESPDGLSWTRLDEQAGIRPSESGWDSEMVCYGAIHDTPTGRFLFYNGNNYGRTGLGVAILDDSNEVRIA